MAGGVAQGVGPELKPSTVQPKKKKKRKKNCHWEKEKEDWPIFHHEPF
jgi:hypothetical protein